MLCGIEKIVYTISVLNPMYILCKAKPSSLQVSIVSPTFLDDLHVSQHVWAGVVYSSAPNRVGSLFVTFSLISGARTALRPFSLQTLIEGKYNLHCTVSVNNTVRF